MSRSLRLFVSAGPELERERDVIGRVVARLPLNKGWEIGRTPSPAQPVPVPIQPTLATTAANCDLFLFLLGQDISAPTGSEWDAARRTGTSRLALLKETVRTPAAQEFQRYAQVEWVRYRAVTELEENLRTHLLRILLGAPERFGLSLPEIEDLAALARTQESPEADGIDVDSRRLGGAGGGGIIMPSPGF